MFGKMTTQSQVIYCLYEEDLTSKNLKSLVFPLIYLFFSPGLPVPSTSPITGWEDSLWTVYKESVCLYIKISHFLSVIGFPISSVLY